MKPAVAQRGVPLCFGVGLLFFGGGWFQRENQNTEVHLGGVRILRQTRSTQPIGYASRPGFMFCFAIRLMKRRGRHQRHQLPRRVYFESIKLSCPVNPIPAFRSQCRIPSTTPSQPPQCWRWPIVWRRSWSHLTAVSRGSGKGANWGVFQIVSWLVVGVELVS